MGDIGQDVTEDNGEIADTGDFCGGNKGTFLEFHNFTAHGMSMASAHVSEKALTNFLRI